MGMIEDLFGESPAEIQRKRIAADEARIMQEAQMDPFDRVRANYGMIGAQLGRSLGTAMGGVDPRVAEAQQRQQALQGLDLSSSQSILAKAQQVQDPKLRMQLALLGQQRQAEERKAQSDAMKLRLDEARSDRERALAERALRGEPEGKYSPEIEKLIRLRDSMGEDDPRRKVVDAAIAKATYIKPESQESAGKPKGLSREAGLKWELDNGMITQEMYDLAMSATPGGKEAAKAGKQADAYKAVEAKVKLTSDAVDEAVKQTGFFTTGLTGKALSNIPGTAAFDIEGTINTILANLGFQELQAMRNASPTGGALGQVAVRELEMLQSTIASLRMGQSKEKQLQSLGKIKTHLDNWKDAVTKSGGAPSSNEQAWEARSPDDVKALYKSGKVSKDQAKAMLKDMGV